MMEKEGSTIKRFLRIASKENYDDYPNPPYKEIVRKDTRPYNCLLIQSCYEYFICIPYRSHIKHRYAYKFKNSIRSKRKDSGLDYSKIVLKKIQRKIRNILALCQFFVYTCYCCGMIAMKREVATKRKRW